MVPIPPCIPVVVDDDGGGVMGGVRRRRGGKEKEKKNLKLYFQFCRQQEANQKLGLSVVVYL